MKVLVIDVGGSHVKLALWGTRKRAKFDSSRTLTPRVLVQEVLRYTAGWAYDRVSLGFPGLVVHGRPVEEPGNLGSGWRRFKFEKALGKPVKIINDAAMQAVGSFAGGRMLFIGLGTGVGSTFIVDHNVVPLELGELPYSEDRTVAQVLKKSGRQ